MATFPDYAKILVEGYDETADYGVLRTQTDSGFSQQRPTQTLANVIRSVSIVVYSDADKVKFDAWFDDDIGRGTGWFDMTAPRTQRTVQARIVGGKFQWGAPAGRVWVGRCQIETLGR